MKPFCTKTLLLTLVLIACCVVVGGLFRPTYADTGITWNPTSVSTPLYNGVQSSPDGLRSDSQGNLYAFGGFRYGSMDFGNGITVANNCSSNSPFLVKYNASGAPVWATGVTNSCLYATFSDVVVSSTGDVYVAGAIYQSGAYDFGNGVIAQGGSSTDLNAVLIKYNSSGIAQWAKSVQGSRSSQFGDLKLTPSGDIVVAGSMMHSSHDFGNGVVLTSVSPDFVASPFLIKYSASGTPVWGWTLQNSAPLPTVQTYMTSLEVDSLGNIYLAGTAHRANFGNSVTINNSYETAIIVKFNENAVAQWVNFAVLSTEGIRGYSLAHSGDLYFMCGSISPGATYNFDNGITLNSTGHVFVQAVNSSGVTQWVKQISGSYSDCAVITADANYVHIGGSLGEIGSFDFGDGITYTGVQNDDTTFVASYTVTGTAVGVHSLVIPGGWSYTYGLTTNSAGDIYAAAELDGAATFDFGNSVSVNVPATWTHALIKYSIVLPPTPTPSPSPSPSPSPAPTKAAVKAASVTITPSPTITVTQTPEPTVTPTQTTKPTAVAIVVDENGKFLSNTTVTVAGKSYVTDASGKFYPETPLNSSATYEVDVNGKKIVGIVKGTQLVVTTKSEQVAEKTSSFVTNIWWVIIVIGILGVGYMLFRKRK